MTSLRSAIRVLVGPSSRDRAPERRRRDPDFTVLTLAVAAGALAAFVGWAVAERDAAPHGAAAAGARASLEESTPGPSPAYAQLPREWRWRRAVVEFDRMYRTERDEEASSLRPGWLRSGPRAR